MKELIVFIATHKDGFDHIEHLKEQFLELFVVVKESEKEDIYYKYNAKTGEFLKYFFRPFEIFNSKSDEIKGVVLFVEKLDDKLSVESFLEEKKRDFLLEYLEQLESVKSENFIDEARNSVTKNLEIYKDIAKNLNAEIEKTESYLKDSEFLEMKKDELMHEVKALNFNSLLDKIKLFLKGIRGGKKGEHRAMIDKKE